MSKADIIRAYLLSKVGLPYELGEELDHNAGPTLTAREDGDCSGIGYAGYTEAKVLINGRPLSRETADTYYHRATRISQPSQVGDAGFFVKHGFCSHVVWYVGQGTVVEAGNHGPNNTYPGSGYIGTCTVAQCNARGAVWGRFAGNDIGELEDDMPMSEFSAAVQKEMEAAQKELVRLGILSKDDRPILEAAPVGYIDMMILRVYKAVLKHFEDLSQKNVANWGSP